MRAGGGFTLTELVIAMAIMVILVSIALPNYRAYTVRANRATARSMLMDLDRAQEAYYLQAHAYAVTMDPLVGTTTGPTSVYIDRERKVSASAGAIYNVQLCDGCAGACGTPTAAAFGLRATPVNQQLTDDPNCSSMCLLATGRKSATGTDSTQCWER